MKTLNVRQVEELFAKMTVEPNWTIFRENPYGGKANPHWIYFYYVYDIDLSGNGNHKALAYYHDNLGNSLSEDDIMAICKKFARNARVDALSDDSHFPPKCGRSFEEVIWRTKSYIVILVDQPGYVLKKIGDCIVIDTSKKKNANHTFFDGKRFQLNLSNNPGVEDLVTAVYFKNYMCDAGGRDIRDEVCEQFDLSFSIEKGRDFLLIPIDPGGTNLGPPVGPPDP